MPSPAKRETSGMSRAPSLLNTPGPVCQEGLAYAPVQAVDVDVAQLLGPPLPAVRSTPGLALWSLVILDAVQLLASPVFAQVSFQVISGMYDLAEFIAVVGGGEVIDGGFQYLAQLLTSLKSVPPTATLKGVEALPLTAKPCCAAVSVLESSHPADPL